MSTRHEQNSSETGSSPAELLDSIVRSMCVETARASMSRRIMLAQSRLKQVGFSTGGSPPYGYDRWLVSLAGDRIRVLAPGEKVTMKWCHVKLLPTNMKELTVVRQINKLSQVMTLQKIAIALTEAKVAPPRGATQKGWSASTVKRIIAHFMHHPEALQISDAHS